MNNEEKRKEIKENEKIIVLDSGMDRTDIMDPVSVCCWAPIMPVRSSQFPCARGQKHKGCNPTLLFIP